MFSKSLSAVLVAMLLLSAPAALADDEQDAFFRALEALSPQSSAVLRAVGRDFHQKCGVAPQVAQYRQILSNSTAFSFLHALAALPTTDALDRASWSPDVTARYAQSLAELDCAAS